jgi:hypothetical protein
MGGLRSTRLDRKARAWGTSGTDGRISCRAADLIVRRTQGPSSARTVRGSPAIAAAAGAAKEVCLGVAHFTVAARKQRYSDSIVVDAPAQIIEVRQHPLWFVRYGGWTSWRRPLKTSFASRFQAAFRSSAATVLVVSCVGSSASWGSAAEVWPGEVRAATIPHPHLLPATLMLEAARNDGPALTAQAQLRAPGTARATETAPAHAGAPAERTCLVLENTVVIAGVSQRAYGVFCAGNDGIWKLVPP